MSLTTMDQHESPKYTAQSPELLLRIFNAYPILKSILSYSHRPDIINLARTCRTLHWTFTATVGRLLNAFPLCTSRLKRCFLCSKPVCKDCGLERREQEKPGETMFRLGYQYALLARRAPHQERYTDGVGAILLGDVRGLINQEIKCFWFCEECFHKPYTPMGKPVQHGWILLPGSSHHLRRQFFVQTMWVGRVPNADNPCTCAMFDTVCEASPHLVRVESLPIQSEFAAFTYQQRGFYPATLVPLNPFLYLSHTVTLETDTPDLAPHTFAATPPPPNSQQIPVTPTPGQHCGSRKATTSVPIYETPGKGKRKDNPGKMDRRNPPLRTWL
ncbi:hypothetical protein BGX38DRAFT_1263268 [Terfezia claveryi]|nr:hypothetical protein BGX38DRAFT_1263268 [Terfezia claveryi]